MYISRIKISNFRIFVGIDLKLNKGLNLLVGENDSGKTALIDAIRYTLGTNSNDRNFLKEKDFHGESKELSIQITFAEVDNYAHRFIEHLSHEEYNKGDGTTCRRSVLHVQLKAHKTSVERRGYPYIKTEIKSGVEGNGLLIESEIQDFLSATYLKPLRDAASELSSGRASRLSQILSSSKEINSAMDDILSIIARANDALLGDDAALKKIAENIQVNYLYKLIFEQDKENLGVFINIAGIRRQTLDGLPENAKHRHLREILEGLSLALTEDRRLHGLGYHNLLFMGAELLLLEQESQNEFPLLLIEEPEAHLHPQLQMKLLQFINSKVNSKVNPTGVQCFLTTHSPNISAKVSPCDIIMLNGGKAFSLRREETELRENDHIYLQKFLDATKANVFFAKSLLFVEEDGENILLPEIARLLGRPLENYGVSVIKYDNSGSWKRFARLFLRKDKDNVQSEQNPTKVCVLRDLDLWPACAEKKAGNLYGYMERKDPKDGKKGNLRFWEKESDGSVEQNKQREDYFKSTSDKHKQDQDTGKSLERQNVKICVSDRWTFEYCLAFYGLFPECWDALNPEPPSKLVGASDEEEATYIQSRVSKTDFAYRMAEILEQQRDDKIEEATGALQNNERNNPKIEAKFRQKVCNDFALALKGKLPPYIVAAIEYVTSPIIQAKTMEEQHDGETAKWAYNKR